MLFASEQAESTSYPTVSDSDLGVYVLGVASGQLTEPFYCEFDDEPFRFAAGSAVGVCPAVTVGQVEVEVRKARRVSAVQARRGATRPEHLGGSSTRSLSPAPGQNMIVIDLTGHEDAERVSGSDKPYSSPQDATSTVVVHGLQSNTDNVEHESPRDHVPLYGCFSCRSGKVVVKLQHGSRDETTEHRRSEEEGSPPKAPFSAMARDSETPTSSRTSQYQGGSHLERKDGTKSEIGQEILDISTQNFDVVSLFEPCLAFPLPRYDKPRRLLNLPHGDLLCVTAHGLMDRFKCGYERYEVSPSVPSAWLTRYRRRRRFLNEDNNFGQVDDACLVKTSDWGTCIVLGHARDHGEISLLRVEDTEVRKERFLCPTLSFS